MLNRRTVVVALMIVCLAGFAVAQDEELPLSNWGAPPYWTPALTPQAERGVGGGMLARVQGMTAQAEALPSSPLPFVAIAPCRIVDTRVATSDGFHQPNFADGEARTFNLSASTDCPGLPATAGAYSVNIQFRPMTQLAFLTAYPTGTTMPLVSTIVGNPTAWTTNAAVVPAGTGGAIDIYCQYAGRVVIDVNGYYASASLVSSLNTLTGDLTLAPGANVTITPSGNTLTIAASAGSLPAGSAGQTLRYGGSGWVASSALTNDGTDVSLTGDLNLAFNRLITLNGTKFLHAFSPSGCLGRNAFFGRNAGSTTMGCPDGSYQASDNAVVGDGAMVVGTTAYQNTAIGSMALRLNETGNLNVAAGYTALYACTAGEFNVAVGAKALDFTDSASDDTAVGYQALTADTTGWENTAVGSNALSATTTGLQNTAVGAKAGARGGTVPAYAGGTVSVVTNQTGSYNTFFGRGTSSTTQVDNCTALGIDAYCDGDNQVRLGNTFVSSIGGKVAFSALSDLRAKTDVRDLELGLDFVLALRPVAYTLRTGNGKTDMGFVAQDIEALLGDGYNVLGIGGDAERTLSLRHTDLIAPLVKAVQEQQTSIEAKDARIAALENQQTAQQAQIEALKAALTARLAAIEARMAAK